MTLLYSCTCLGWNTSIDCINLENLLIVAQRFVNCLWNPGFPLLIDAKIKAVLAGATSKLPCSHAVIACVLINPPLPHKKTWPFCETRTPQQWVQLWRCHISKTLTFFLPLAFPEASSTPMTHFTSCCSFTFFFFFQFSSQQVGPWLPASPHWEPSMLTWCCCTFVFPHNCLQRWVWFAYIKAFSPTTRLCVHLSHCIRSQSATE